MDNIVANPGSGGARFATREVTYSTDATTHVTVTAIAAFAGADDAKTVADIGGDAANGLDVDVTRLPTLVAGTAIIGKVGIDQTTPGTTDSVSVATAQGAGATIGTTAGAKVVSDASGTLQQYLRGLVTFLANALGAGTAATATRVVLATDDVIAGALTETAPTTDTASSGLNGRLQRIAQRLTALISPGLSASVSVTRPSDTTTYSAGDVVGITGGGTATITFALGAISASRLLITSLTLQRNATAVLSGEVAYRMHWFSVTQPAAQIDNAIFDVAAGDQASYLGYSDLVALTDLGSTLISENNSINKQIKLAGTSLFGVLQTVGSYTPASAAVHVITLHAVQL